MLKLPGTERLKLKYGELLSCLGSKFKLRRYTKGIKWKRRNMVGSYTGYVLDTIQRMCTRTPLSLEEHGIYLTWPAPIPCLALLRGIHRQGGRHREPAPHRVQRDP